MTRTGQAAFLEPVPEPDRERPRLHANALRLRSTNGQPPDERFGLARHLPLGDHVACLIDDAHGRHPERYIQTHILRHRGSPGLAVRFCILNPAKPGKSRNPPRDGPMSFIPAG